MKLLISSAAALVIAAAKPPSYIVMLADDMGYGDLSIYGHPTIRTPNTDRLAMEGMRFTQMYSPHPLCTPSRTALMTGRYASRSGMICGWLGGVLNACASGGLPHNETTLPQSLAAVGYDTQMIGKWHLGQLPQHNPTLYGFHDYLGIPYSVDMGTSRWEGMTPELPGMPVPLPLLHNLDVVEQPVDLSTLTERYSSAAVAFLANHTAPDAPPFFLYLAFQHVHAPMFCSLTWCNSSIRGEFGDNMAELDAAVGVIMDYVRANFAGDDVPLVFFTSDNGPWFEVQTINGGSAGLFYDGKASTWEGGQRVPGIYWWPGRIPALSSTSAVSSSMDFFVTAATLSGAALPTAPYDGLDISSVLFNASATPHECFYYWRGQDEVLANGTLRSGLWAIRCGPFKAHFITKSGYENDTAVFHNPALLFNIEHDPSERWPLDATQYAGLLANLTAIADAHHATVLPVANQCAEWNASNAICGCPDSQKIYPTLPNCTCNASNWFGPPYFFESVAGEGQVPLPMVAAAADALVPARSFMRADMYRRGD